jgi:hypothetical protein
MILLLLVGGLLQEAPKEYGFEGYPPQIQRILDERKAWEMGRLEWEWHRNVLFGDYANKVSFSREIVTEFHGPNLREVNYGNREGSFADQYPDEYGEGLGPDLETRPRRSLVYDDLNWVRHGQSCVVRATPRERSGLNYVHDPWTLGLAGSPDPEMAPLGIPPALMTDWDGPGQVQAVRNDNIELVELSWSRQGLGFRVEWELDHDQGGLPIRTTAYFPDGRRFQEMIAVNKEQNGVWYPTRVEYWTEVEQNDVFNHAVDVQSFEFVPVPPVTLDDLGIDFGHNIWTPDGLRFWTGTDLVTTEERDEMVYELGIHFGPKWVRDFTSDMSMTEEEYRASIEKRRIECAKARGVEYASGLTFEARDGEEVHPWVAYTRKFVEEHDFEKERKERAFGLLDQCLRLRRWYEHRHREDFERVEKDLKGGTPSVHQRAKRQWIELHKPIDKIFETRLKKGLVELSRTRDRSPVPAAASEGESAPSSGR